MTDRILSVHLQSKTKRTIKIKIMTTQEINNGLIGKNVSLMVTGLRVKGIITGIYKTKTYTGNEVLGLEIDHEPVQWGKDVYTHSTSIGSNLSTIKFI